MMQPARPAPGNPPVRYALDYQSNAAIFYRRVSETEYAAWKTHGALQPEPGGMAFGKHVTTTADLARSWAARLVEWGHEASIGRVLEIRLPVHLAERVAFVGPNTDGIEACYFIAFGLLDSATITEVSR